MKKIAIGIFACLLVLCMSQDAQATEKVDIQSPQEGAAVVDINLDAPLLGDWFRLNIGNEYYTGVLTEKEVASKKLAFELPAGKKLTAGDNLRIEVANGGNKFVSDDKKVGASSQSNAFIVAYPETVRPGREVKPNITFTDATGKTIDVANKVDYAFEGSIKKGSFDKGCFVVAEDAAAGSVIIVRAKFGDHSQDAVMRVIIGNATDAPNPVVNKGIELEKSQSPIGKASSIAFKLTEKVPSATRCTLEVTSKENPMAQTDAQIVNSEQVIRDGKGNVSLLSTAVGSIQYALVMYDSSGKEQARYPFKHRFGMDLGENQAQMTIGLKTIYVGDVKKTIDTAPFIQNGRTFVPLRALAEAFGAEVAYQDSDRSITIKTANRTILMHINDKVCSVNGAVMTMDTAPYISKETGRTIVPVRFAAEGLGFQIDVKTDANGLTDHIIFSK